MTADPDIYLAGLGLRPSHITAETSAALAECQRIYHISYVPETAELLSRFCSDVVDLRSLYEEGADRLRTYKRQAAEVLNGAFERKPVALAVYGHPLLLAMPSMFVLRLGPAIGMSVRPLPAVSALDCLMADLGVDPTTAGLQSHEATDLLLHGRPLIPTCATVLWQVGSLETRLHVSKAASRPERLHRLRDHLLRFYPPDHPAIAVSTAVTDHELPERLTVQIVDLPRHSSRLHLGTTLYIPPVGEGSVDQSLVDQLTSREHLAAITAARQ